MAGICEIFPPLTGYDEVNLKNDSKFPPIFFCFSKKLFTFAVHLKSDFCVVLDLKNVPNGTKTYWKSIELFSWLLVESGDLNKTTKGEVECSRVTA